MTSVQVRTEAGGKRERKQERESSFPSSTKGELGVGGRKGILLHTSSISPCFLVPNLSLPLPIYFSLLTPLRSLCSASAGERGPGQVQCDPVDSPVGPRGASSQL